MQRREVTAKIRVSKLARLLSRVRRISAEEKREKISSADSGNSQNYSQECQYNQSTAGKSARKWFAYACPVCIIGGDHFGLGEPKDALLEAEF